MSKMKIVLIFLFFLVLVHENCNSQVSALIPYPQQVNSLPGKFVFSSSTVIIASEPLGSIAGLFAESASDILGHKLKVTERGD